MNLWLDDLRNPPSSVWTWAKTVDEAIEVLMTGSVEIASLDYDLSFAYDREHPLGPSDALQHTYEETGEHLLLWMAMHDVWPRREISVHSGDADARDVMILLIETEGPFRRVGSLSTLVRQERELQPDDE